MRRLTLVLALTLAALALAAPAAAQTDAVKGVYAGRVQGTNAYIGLVARSGKVTVYVCDSKTIAEWLGGRVAKGKATLGGTGGLRVRAVFGRNGVVTGTVTLEDGSKHRFRALRATGKNGLWQATGETDDGARYWAGWILLRDGSQRGAVTRIAKPGQDNLIDPGSDHLIDPDGDHAVEPAPALDPASPSVSINGVAARAKRITSPLIDPGSDH